MITPRSSTFIWLNHHYHHHLMYFREQEKECHIPLSTILSKLNDFWDLLWIFSFRWGFFLQKGLCWLGFCKVISGLRVCVRDFTWAWNLGSLMSIWYWQWCGLSFLVCVFRGKYTAQFGINIYCLFSHLEPFYPPSLLSLCSWAAASILAAADRKTLILLTNSLA